MLIGSILSRTVEHARRSWKRLLGVYLLTTLVGVLLGAWAQASFAGGGSETLGVVLLVAVQLVGCWAAVAAVRVPLHNDDISDALGEGASAAPRLFVGSLVLVLLVVPTLFVLPHVVLLGAIADRRRALGLGPALRMGMLRFVRNIGVYVALLLVVAVITLLAAALFLLPLLAAAGVPGEAELASASAFADWIEDAWGATLIGSGLAALPGAVLWPCFVAATWVALCEREDTLGWRDEDLEAVPVTQELSPVVASLLGPAATPSAQPARARPRMRIPPRAPEPGRLPGPGVLTVADLVLPPGASTRPVDSPTLELDVSDAAPSSSPGVVAAPAVEAMWVSSQPYDAAPGAWRQLGAGFAETGLWPLLLPASSLQGGVPWYEQRARRERDALDATADELLRARLEDSLPDSPLSSTDLIAASGVRRGQLARGSGRRTDALAHAFDELGSAHLALVPARRPADSVHRMAWPGSSAARISGAELAELLASWEMRYGALLVGLTESTLWFAVLRPPANLEEAVEVAAEHHATCPDEALDWGDDRSYAQRLVDAPVWHLGWS